MRSKNKYFWIYTSVLATPQVSLKFLEKKNLFSHRNIYNVLFIHIRNWKCVLFKKFSLTKFKVVEILYLHDSKRIKFTYETLSSHKIQKF